MAYFRNKDKKRSRETGLKRVYPPMVAGKPSMANFKFSGDPADVLKTYYSAHPVTAGDQRAGNVIKIIPMPDFHDLSPAPRPTQRETWREYFYLMFFRFRRGLTVVWAAARFQKAGAWLPADKTK